MELFISSNPQLVMVIMASTQMAIYSVGWLVVLVALRADRLSVLCWALGWLVLGAGLG
jgi:hypothetical protein